jgi:formylmethanofuran dehydrogenase subunit C
VATLCLTLRETPAQRVDMSPLTAGHLLGKGIEDVASLELATGNRKVRLDSLFSISGTFASELEIHGSCDRLDRIGAGMSHGRVVVRGDVGAYLGAGMSGGSLVIRGNAGAYAATGMRGGRIHVYGSTGDFLAAARPGERHGMQGGLVLIDGDTGARLGDRMRRGMVLIEGNAGDYCATRMVAGTIAVWGTVGKLPGLGMRRGTLLLQRPSGALPPTFNDCGEYPLNFLVLLVRSWRTLRSKYSTLPDAGLRVRRYMGDVANGGRGEILVRA